jgi:hypothetical protein
MEAKPFASLSSSLLARKGQAKPAMRPQGFNGFGAPQEDLGWNDMGFSTPSPVPAGAPPVVHQQEELAAHFTAPAPAPEKRPAKARTPRAASSLAGHKAAFTLRLDEDRHLRLRLASALQRRSSQRLVTEALDALLNAMPGLDEMVAKAGRNLGKGNA